MVRLLGTALGWVVQLIEQLWPVILFVCVTALTILVIRSIDQGNSLRTLIDQRHADKITREVEVAQHQENSAINQGVNVETWCGYDDRIVSNERTILMRAAPQLVGLVPPPLDCYATIRATLESASREPTITSTGTPLVYRALHGKKPVRLHG